MDVLDVRQNAAAELKQNSVKCVETVFFPTSNLPTSSKEIVDNMAPWKNWCRLCASKEVETGPNESGSSGSDFELVEKYCGIKLLEETPREPNWRCRPCLRRLKEWQEYVEHVRAVQDMYHELWALEQTDEPHSWQEVLERFDLKNNGKRKDASLPPTAAKPNKESKIKDEVEDMLPDILDESVEQVAGFGPDLTYSDDEKSVKEEDNESVKVRTTRSLSKKCKTTSKKPTPRRRPNVCKTCNLHYKTFSNYRRHMRIKHKKDIPFAHSCSTCSRAFPTALQLEAHSKSHLPIELKQAFGCIYCEKKFTTPYVMEKHISAVHLNEKPYICEECGSALKSSSSLKTHMLTHTDERPFKCEHCEKAFKNYPALKRHKEAHSENKFVCTDCGFQFSTSASLKRHMVVHSDVKMFKCEFCQQEFKRAEAYKHHLLLHTGLKPYACNFCDRTFANGSNCRSHLKKTHPIELAAFEEKAGKVAAFTNNLPKMAQLKELTKNAKNICQVNSKQKSSSTKYCVDKSKEDVINVPHDSCGDVAHMEG